MKLVYFFLQTVVLKADDVILGGTRGMGRQMVEAFLLEGANVSYCARTADGAEFDEFLKTLPESNKATILGTALDISSKTALDDWIKAGVQKFGGLDVVIANGKAVRRCNLEIR